MPYDIYTKQLITQPTDEHVLPRALGGRLSGINIIDKTTNDRFGHGIDASLAEALRAFRLTLDARSTDGTSPRTLTKVRGEDGKDYIVEAGGVVRAPPRGELTVLPSGEKRFSASVPDEQTLRRMLRRHFKGREDGLAAFVAEAMADATYTKAPIPRLTFGLPLWKTDPYRATAKIAFNLLALEQHDMALTEGFDEIRAFVLDGKTPSVEPVQSARVPFTESTLGPVDHVVVLEVRADGEVMASIVYFGHLGFLVRLGTVPPETPPMKFTYRVDQLAGNDRRNHDHDLQLALPSFQEAVDRSSDDLVALATEQAGTLVAVTENLQTGLFLRRITEPHLAQLREENRDEGVISIEEAQSFITTVVRVIAAELGPKVEQGGGSASEFELLLRDSLLRALESDKERIDWSL